jgi:hypothetical protein
MGEFRVYNLLEVIADDTGRELEIYGPFSIIMSLIELNLISLGFYFIF